MQSLILFPERFVPLSEQYATETIHLSKSILSYHRNRSTWTFWIPSSYQVSKCAKGGKAVVVRALG